jgi:4-carboxymuconolactone decarboxylase
MAISDAARKNHDELFPGHASTLKATDPELIEAFGNFAFDEVLRYGDLDTRTRLMLQLASMIASGALSEYRIMLGAALTVGVTAVQAKEIVYQAVPYVGMAKVFDFIHATNEVLIERGVELPLPGQATTTPENRVAKGLELMQQIVGAEAVDGMRAAAAEDEFHFQNYLAGKCFGDYLTRSGLDVKTRELLTFSMLIPSVAVSRRPRDTQRPTSASATTGASCSVSSLSCCRSSATPHTERAAGHPRGGTGLRGRAGVRPQ